MNMHDKAHELASAIKEFEAYREMKAVRRQIDADGVSKAMLGDFRRLQSELNRQAASGVQPQQTEVERLEKLYGTIAQNPAIRKLFEAERQLSEALEEVQRIIAEPLREMMD
ncbi:YlbF family regulator [Paenibacillus athensensis]|uniref:Uncharacterized protein n=1 Tax=Paenibacillus athensensis TaxID=1967502 RepID=A0A4Y8PW79_9BACL|nr:YlbF family regulator [Paenibacillus athensensis]MCD1258866.1 YlbF family regulator [Paenibacillus athensensis]